MQVMADKVRSLEYLNGQWCLITEKRDNVASQSLLVSEGLEWPAERIQKFVWSNGRRIIQVNYVAEHWYLFAERLEDEPMEEITQTVHFSKEFPKELITDTWKEGKRVVTVYYCTGNETWVLIAEKPRNPDPPAQSIVISSEELPSKDVQTFWNETKRVSLLTFGAGLWVILAEVRDQSAPAQAYTANSDFPEAKINERYKGNMRISSIAWSTKDEVWAVVFDTSGGKGQHFQLTNSFPEDHLKQVGVSRYGKRFY